MPTDPSFVAGHTGITPPDQYRNYMAVQDQYLLPNGQLLGLGAGSLVRINADGTLISELGHAPSSEMGSNILLITSGFKLLPDGKAIIGGHWQTGLSDNPTGYAVFRLNADGTLDKTFAKGQGWAQTDPGNIEQAAGTVVARDGKVLVVGTSSDSSPADSNNFISISRFTAKGEVDLSFGNKGSILHPGSKVWLNAVQMQSDGKILAAGSHRVEPILSDGVVFRFNEDGSPDTSFGAGGKVTLKFPGTTGGSQIYAMTIQPDGKIITVGEGPVKHYNGILDQFAIARFNPDGSLDSEFGIDGRVTVHVAPNQGTWVPGAGEFGSSNAHAVIVRDDGTIIVSGDTLAANHSGRFDYQFAMVALRPNGEVDTSFGNQGKATSDTGPAAYIYSHNLVETADGHLLLSGSKSPTGANMWYSMSSFNADGTPDSTFGAVGSGKVNQIVFREGYASMALNPGAVLHDNELAATGYQGASLQLQRRGGANADDRFDGLGGLSLADGNVTIDGIVIGTASSSAGSLRMQFNAAATEALVNKTLHLIGYRNAAALDKNEAVTIDWLFNDGGATAQISTGVKLVAGTGPAWIEQLLATQDAAGAASDLQSYLGAGHTLNVRYLAGGNAGALPDTDVKLIDALLANIAGVSDLKFVAGTTAGSGKLEIHSSAVLGAGQTAYAELSSGGADVFLGKPASTSVRGLLPELNMRILQALGLEGNGIKSSTLSEVQIATLQYLYGPSTTARTGNDIYKLSASGANFLWDGKGADTIDGSSLTQDLTLHLEAGHWDYIGSKGDSITAAGQVTVNFGSSFENAIGGSGNDKLYGTTGTNNLRGGGGNDLITGYGGDDTIDGGAGLDTVSFAGKRADFTIARTAKGYTVTSSASLDTLSNVERLHFDNGDVALDINGNAGQLFRLYQAIFNRKPDLVGLGWWLDAVDRGTGMESVAESFIQSAEFTKMYGANASNTDLLNKIYEYALHRTPDKEGFAYWLDVLDNHKASLGSVLMGFSESQENYAQVIGSIQNGIAYTAFHG